MTDHQAWIEESKLNYLSHLRADIVYHKSQIKDLKYQIEYHEHEIYRLEVELAQEERKVQHASTSRD